MALTPEKLAEDEKWLTEHGFTKGDFYWSCDGNVDIKAVFRDGCWHGIVAGWTRSARDVREAIASATRAAKDSVMWTNEVVADAEKLTASGT